MDESRKRNQRRKIRRLVVINFDDKDCDVEIPTNDIESSSEEDLFQNENCFVNSDLTSSCSSNFETEFETFSTLDENNFDDLDENITPLQSNLRLWAAKYNLSRNCVNDVLAILSSGLDVPKDSRTLMKTERVVENITHEGETTYKYFGIKYNLSLLKHNTDTIDLVVNVDGLPLSKS